MAEPFIDYPVGTIRDESPSINGMAVYLRDLDPDYQTIIRKELLHREQIKALDKTVDHMIADMKDGHHEQMSMGQFLRHKKSQAEKVREWLLDHKEIGLKESLFEDHGIGSARLAAVIHVLRHDHKMNIKTRMVKTPTTRKTVGRYILYPGAWDGNIDEPNGVTSEATN